MSKLMSLTLNCHHYYTQLRELAFSDELLKTFKESKVTVDFKKILLDSLFISNLQLA
jgi:hypothetical protein